MTEEQLIARIEFVSSKYVDSTIEYVELVNKYVDRLRENIDLRAEIDSLKARLDAQALWANALLDGLHITIRPTCTGKLEPCEYCGTVGNVFPRSCCTSGEQEDFRASDQPSAGPLEKGHE